MLTRTRRGARTPFGWAVRLTIGLATAVVATALALPTPAPAAPPTHPSCVPLAAGTTGLFPVGGQLPTVSDQLADGPGGFGPIADQVLPRMIWFKDGAHAVSNAYAFASREGDLFVARAHEGRVGIGEQWHQLRLPPCLAGGVDHVSADHRLLLVQTADGQVYSHDMPGDDLSPERWTWRWGPFLWLGAGVRVGDDVSVAAASEFTGAETFRDSAGRRHHAIGVATYYLLRQRGTRITYLDPWLPSDLSREVCLPRAGRSRLASLDASGSTVLAATRDGALFTRLYDFDVTGANPIFGSYTWQTGLAQSDDRWQLPIGDWRRQPPPPGPITDRVSIVKTGTDARHRELRVAGRWRGRTGVWVKPIGAPRWRFHPAAVELGRRLPLSGHTVARPGVRFLGTLAGAPARIAHFDWACTPTELQVRVGRTWLRLRLHAYDGLRQNTRRAGLDDTPRLYNAALEVPPATWRTASVAQRAWLERHLDGRFTEAPIEVTATRLQFRVQCWQLTRDGQPPRPDAVAAPDVGPLLAEVMAIPDGGVPAGPC